MGIFLPSFQEMDFSKIAIFITFSLTGCFAVEWSDAGIKVSTKEQAHFTDAKLYEIMSTGSDVYVSCQSGRGEYPTGGTMGKAFCLFDKLNWFAGDEKMKINWDEIHTQFGEHSHMVDECKDTDYDVMVDFGMELVIGGMVKILIIPLLTE